MPPQSAGFNLAGMLSHGPFLLIFLIGLGFAVRQILSDKRSGIILIFGFLALLTSQALQIYNRYLVSLLNAGTLPRATAVSQISLNSAFYFLLAITGWICILYSLYSSKPDKFQEASSQA